VTPTVRPGADVSYVGIARPDDRIIEPVGSTPEGWPIFERPFGFGFTLVIEGRTPDDRVPGLSTFEDFGRPALRIIVSRPLGDGSAAVCDDRPPVIGGVPASASFAESSSISNAINDFGCRFVDGNGLPTGRGSSQDACTRFPDGSFHFVNPMSRAQFCGPIAPPFGFAVGDTVVTVRLADRDGAVGPSRSFVIRVLEED
jgi:hypothetical protein